ncbi:X-X-X-Leu-X-X-Gly heptad repeats protein [Dermabacter vaginalis]|uniref:X-X-X-Leu-X-X-Gly heptad repeats protein n=1 Tax=Dermabacter vaginalis TaxID=1630135 RepID=A0A1B0ZL65_9MICO|nr:YhgE/Pip domain-containing protein [Dermabacter vaginalis]ANP28658.1 X-X-X-Leu-X-X-Gly heptad repeats protein [Dermabacter vaginalis]
MSQATREASRKAKANSIARRLRNSGNSLSIIRIMILVIGVSLVPLVYAALLTWSNVDPINRLHQVPAAVVNLDKGNTDPDLDLGDELTDELLDSTANNNLDWTEMSESRANKALQDGEVYAVLRIPENFSSNVASVGNDDPSTAVKAQLSITTNDAKNMISGNLAQTILTKVTDSLNEKVSDEYLHNIYAGFNDMHDSLSEAEDGAGQLADGSSDAKDGADKLADGTATAKDGSSQLADGTATAKNGSGKLVVGLGDLKDGAVKLSSGASTLANGTTQLKDATGRAASGAGDLANGVGRLDSAAGQLNDGATKVNAGALRLRDGLTNAQDGSAKIAAGLNELNSKTSILPGAVAELKNGSAALADGSELIAERMEDLSERGPEIVDDLHKVKDKTRGAHDEAVELKKLTVEDVEGTEDYAESLADIQAHWDEMDPDQQKLMIDGLKDGADQIAERSRKINAGVSDLDLKIIVPLDVAAHALDNKVNELPALFDHAAAKSREVADKFKRLDDGVGKLDAKSTELVDGINQLATGANTLDDGLGKLSNGAGDLTDGTGRLADGTGQLKDGTGTALAGASALADGAGKLDAASGKLNDGAQRLASGTGDLTNGASKLKDGATKLDGGIGKLNDGAVKLNDGIGQLDDGAHKLGGGLGDLKDGANELHDGLAAGVEEVPNYNTSEKDHLASVAAQQVDLSKHRLHEVKSYGYGLGPYFMTLSLWIGALAFFLVFPALSGRRVGSNMPAAMVALASYLPSAFVSLLQSVLMVSTVHFLVGIDMVRLGQAFLISFIASLTFMALNQALVACFGPVGRFMSLIFTVLQLASAGATYPIETTPKLFQMISPYLPFTSVVNALRVAIAGGDINFAHVIWVMVAYAAVAAVMLVLGVRAKRRVEKLKEKIHDRVESAEREDGSATETAEGSEGAVDPDGPSESAEEPEDAEAPRGEEGTDSSAPEQEA